MTGAMVLGNAAPAARPAPGVTADRALLRFSVTIVLVSVILQRFGLIFGTSFLSIVGPIGLALAGLGLLRGALAIDFARFAAWLGMLACIILGMSVRSAIPSPFGGNPSMASVLQFVGLNGFAILSFARPVEEMRFFRFVNACLAFTAAAGLVQFVVQFAGLRLFTFEGIFPFSTLIEPFFNTAIPIGDSSYFKSNGFFLLEPSMFSQFMALALLIEVLTWQRMRYLALFGAALVCSVSGTGWLMIISFLVSAVLNMGRRGVPIVIGTVLLGGLALGGLDLILPQVFAAFQGRMSEFQLPGTSGHMRFVTPWWIAHDVLAMDPLTWFVGLGAGVSEHLGRFNAYEYNVNAPIKLLLEYGLPTLILYLLLWTLGRRTRVQKALLLPVLVMVLLDGGYQQQPYILFPTMLVCLLANLQPAGAPQLRA